MVDGFCVTDKKRVRLQSRIEQINRQCKRSSETRTPVEMHEFVLSGRGAQASVYERDETPQKRTAPDDTVERGMMGVVVRMERGSDRNDSYGERRRKAQREKGREKDITLTLSWG